MKTLCHMNTISVGKVGQVCQYLPLSLPPSLPTFLPPSLPSPGHPSPYPEEPCQQDMCRLYCTGPLLERGQLWYHGVHPLCRGSSFHGRTHLKS